ncbi:MAG: Hpt domain-containing protein [Rhodocyclaceae bacterium]|nr:Hpt domain-containing protein [Rhodocyclaceae bacterium]
MAAYSLDKALILDRLGDDEEIFTMMVDMYLQDVENNCTSLSSLLAAGDQPSLQREAHTIKGLLATFADDEGTAMAAALEMRVKMGDLSDLAPAIAALQARLREVSVVLQAAIAG